jgi:hypothetical protein
VVRLQNDKEQEQRLARDPESHQRPRIRKFSYTLAVRQPPRRHVSPLKRSAHLSLLRVAACPESGTQLYRATRTPGAVLGLLVVGATLPGKPLGLFEHKVRW